MIRRSAVSPLAWLVVALTSGACYGYVPSAALAPKPGSEIRVQMAAPADFQVGDLTIHEVSTVEGNVYQATGDSVALWSQWIYSRMGRYEAGGAVLFIPRSATRVLEERKLNAAKTGVGVAVTGAVMAFFFELVRRTTGGGGTLPPVTGNPG